MIKLVIALLQLFVNESKVLHTVKLRLGISLMLLGVSWSFVLIGLGFVVWAFYLYLTNYLNPPLAALASGFLLLFIAIVVVLIVRRLIRFRISVPGKLSWVGHHPKEATLLVLLAGFIAGSTPKAREALTEGLIWFLKRGKS